MFSWFYIPIPSHYVNSDHVAPTSLCIYTNTFFFPLLDSKVLDLTVVLKFCLLSHISTESGTECLFLNTLSVFYFSPFIGHTQLTEVGRDLYASLYGSFTTLSMESGVVQEKPGNQLLTKAAVSAVVAPTRLPP